MEVIGSAQTDSIATDSYEIQGPKSFRLAAISQHCWFARVLVGDLAIKMLVDTGSAVTLLSKQTLNLPDNIELQDESSILTTAYGEPMTVIGRCTVDLGILNNRFCQLVMVANFRNLEGIIILCLDF